VKSLLLALVLTLLPTPALAAVPGIVDGTPVDISDAPWMVSLVDLQGHPFCDGVLVGPTTVLTAAHCLAGRTADGIGALGGRSDLNQIADSETVSKVTAIAAEPGYVAPQRGADLAGLTLDTPFPYQPLPIDTDTSTYRPGTMGTVYGWGRLGANGPATTVLHEAEVPVVADDTCQRIYDTVVTGSPYDPHAMFCAGYVMPPNETGPDACRGDDGGPLVVDGKLAGIVSWGVSCGRYPSFYTRIASYLG